MNDDVMQVWQPTLRERIRYFYHDLKARFFPGHSNLTAHAYRELRAAGWFDKGSAYDGMIGPAVMALVSVYSAQGHSGMSAGIVRGLFEKVGNFQPICPLTGADDEWVEVSSGTFQNNRCSHVFKESGQAYDIDGRIFREPSGVCYTNRDSRVPVIFPYTPKREYVDVPDTKNQ